MGGDFQETGGVTPPARPTPRDGKTLDGSARGVGTQIPTPRGEWGFPPINPNSLTPTSVYITTELCTVDVLISLKYLEDTIHLDSDTRHWEGHTTWYGSTSSLTPS